MADIFSERVVAFLDLLGFTERFREFGRDQEGGVNYEFYQDLRSIFLEVIAREVRARPHVEEELRLSAINATYFSDSIVISCLSSSVGAEVRVLEMCRRLARKLLARGFPCRGGMAYGPTYHQGDIVFGEGFLKAYNLESRVANYPRIALAEDLGKRLKRERHGSSLIAEIVRSSSGVYYVEFFGKVTEFDSEAVGELESAAQEIAKGLERSRKKGQPDIVAKWMWLRNSCNREIRYCNKNFRSTLAPIPENGKG